METIVQTGNVARETISVKRSGSVLVRYVEPAARGASRPNGSVVRYLAQRVTFLNQCAFLDHAKIDGSRFLPAGLWR
jgi:hypothetical protein